MSSAFEFVAGSGQVLSTAVHAGHEMRADLAPYRGLAESVRLMEEDPYTDRLLPSYGSSVVVLRSRFEVDLNRARSESVYLCPEDAWGLHVWSQQLPERVVEESRSHHDRFYAELASHLDRLSGDGPFLVLDVHSYNHRRDGPTSAAADPGGNPEVNVGTGALDRRRWTVAVDTFMGELSSHTVDGHRLDVRENVRFRGGYVSRWVVEHYPQMACVLSVEFKKTFMDEWTGQCDTVHLDQLRGALESTVEPTLIAVAKVA